MSFSLGGTQVGTYFVRLFWTSKLYTESADFTVVDHSCDNVNCLNGGTCYSGQCVCLPAWKNATCNVPVDSCEQKGVDCGIWGKCDGGGHCTCVAGWSGDICQYPPNCNIRCSHNGLPNDPTMAVLPGNSWGCTYCDCVGGYEGTTCDQCGIECFHGGSVNSLCSSCTCPTWYTGERCELKYWIASFKVDINPPNFDLNKASGSSQLAEIVTSDITASIPSLSGMITVQAVGNTVTVFITGGENSPILRAQLYREVSGSNYWGGAGSQGLNLQTTLTGEKIVASSYVERDPPSAGAFTSPSLLITTIIILLALLLK